MTPADLERKRIDLDRARCGPSFERFARKAWPEIDPAPLVWGWHMGALAEHLQAVSEGEIRDLVICIPPGCSKSKIVSALWPAWDWIDHPWRGFLGAAYIQSLAEKEAKLHRDLVLSPWYQARWGDKVQIGKAQSRLVRAFQNTAKGFRFSTSVMGGVTGWHADIRIADDLNKAQDAQGKAAITGDALKKSSDFYWKAYGSRRKNAVTFASVIIGQRLHDEDVPGQAIERGYTALVLPMEYDPKRSCVTVRWRPDASEPGGVRRIEWQDPRTEKGQLLAPERFPQAVVDQDKKDPGTFAAQQQQDPVPEHGLLFELIGEKRWTTPPTVTRRILVCDAAFKDKKTSDPVSCQVWGANGTNFYLLDNETERMNFGRTCDTIRALLARHPGIVGVYVEDKANGPAIIETLTGEIPGIVAWQPGSESKLARAEAMAPLVKAGNVWIPADGLFPWIPDFLTELRRFPMARHDDQVDALVMALRILHDPLSMHYASAWAAVRKQMGGDRRR